MTGRVYLNALGLINAIGTDKQSIRRRMLAGESPGMKVKSGPLTGKPFFVGAVEEPLPLLPRALAAYDCRNNRLAMAAALQIEDAIVGAREEYGAERVGVVIGTSTSGVDEAEKALAYWQQCGNMPDNFNYVQQEIGASADFLAHCFDLQGPAYAISTACSSSGKVFASARGLITSGLCDAVIVGGADTLCELTLNGFASLAAASDALTNPFSRNRRGINVGEGAAIFLMSRTPAEVLLAGIGESADAHHMSAPAPDGSGAKAAMQAALLDAGLETSAIQYINLHGTGTQLNDSMESHAVYELFGCDVDCSSSKTMTGHTLGAAGATEAALCWLLLTAEEKHHVLPHCFDGEPDPQLSDINLNTSGRTERPVCYIMSNSFAFGGNNVSVILGRSDD